ncbi:MAG: hypothetical protein IPP71_22985 [Bacteroidetes bacterium]|nr:hypothetical protein [Bacteroidota bacterium]
MKTIKNLTGLLLFFFVISIAKSAVTFPGLIQTDTKNSAQGYIYPVRAIFFQGTLMPIVDLPLVEIKATRPGSIIASGSIQNGEFLICVDLPLVEIIGNRKKTLNAATFVRNDERIVTVNLPQIEIVSDFPINNLVKVNVSGSSNIIVINLMQINIVDHHLQSGKSKQSISYQVNVYAPNISKVNSDSDFNVKKANTDRVNSFVNENSAKFYVTLKKIGIGEEGTDKSEIVSQAKIHSSLFVNTTLTSMIIR